MPNGCKSEWKQVISGLPQGSVLGPLLFIIFVNTIEKGIDSKVLKFASDLQLSQGLLKVGKIRMVFNLRYTRCLNGKKFGR